MHRIDKVMGGTIFLIALFCWVFYCQTIVSLFNTMQNLCMWHRKGKVIEWFLSNFFFFFAQSLCFISFCKDFIEAYWNQQDFLHVQKRSWSASLKNISGLDVEWVPQEIALLFFLMIIARTVWRKDNSEFDHILKLQLVALNYELIYSLLRFGVCSP